MPFVSPVTSALVAEPPAVAVKPPGLDSTSYCVIALPLAAAAVHDTVAWPSPAAAATLPGGATDVQVAEVELYARPAP